MRLRQSLILGCMSLQRYAQGNALKRTIFELIAHEIIKMVPDTPDPSDHGNASGAAG